MIFLVFLSEFPAEDRQLVIENLMQLETEQRLRQQFLFFQKFRPFQQTLGPQNIDANKTKEAKEKLCSFWKRSGWPKYNKGDPPPIKEMAQKSAPRLLEVVYDFIYRFTSGAVHFQAGWLLRLGWENADKNTTFSSRNMSNYDTSITQIYGAFIMCIYFELFDSFIHPEQKEKDIINDLRRWLFQFPRWPEMITFEEMNLPVPESGVYPEYLLRALYTVVMDQGFVSGTEEILKL